MLRLRKRGKPSLIKYGGQLINDNYYQLIQA